MDLDRAARDDGVLLGKVGAEHDDVAGVRGGQGPARGDLELEGMAFIGPGDQADHRLGDPEAGLRTVGGPRDLDLRIDGVDAGEGRDVCHGRQPDRRGPERLAVGDDDLPGIQVAAGVDEAVDPVGQRAEHDERPDADRNPEDGEGRAQLSPRELTNEPHD